MKRALKIIGIVLVVLLVVVIALPFLVDVNSFRPRLESELTSALGRDVKVGKLSLSIISGSVAAEDLAIADDPAFGKDPFVRAKSLNVGVEIMPLIFSKALHVTELTIDEPQISLLRSASGKWNFSSMGSSASSAKPKTEAGAETANPSLTVSKLNVKDGSVTVGRANSSKTHTYQNVDITVRDFSFTSEFPFTLTASLPGGGDLKLDGKAGPINPNDAAETPLQAQVNVKHLDLASSGFVDPSSGIAGIADFDGTLNSDGHRVQTNGTVKADKLKLAEKASPAGRPVEVKYAITHDLQKQAGTITQGEVMMGKAVAQLTGSYQTQGESTLLNMKLNGQGMPVDDLEAMLPALGVVLPSGSSLKGGTLSTALAITGAADKPVITGPLRLADTKLTGFDLGSKLAAISALSGAKTGSDTAIQNLSTDAHVAPSGIRTENINLTIPALGVLTGSGTISPGGGLDYKMTANLAGAALTGLTQLAGMGNKGASIPFFIQGTTSNPSFRPDVQGMLNGRLKSMVPGQGQTAANPLVNALGGLFGKKKKTK
jgi:AsmA protein